MYKSLNRKNALVNLCQPVGKNAMPLSDGIFYSYNFFSPIFVPFYRFLFIIIIIIPTFILFHYTYICAQAETSSFHPLPKENDRSEEIIRKGKKNPSIRAVWKRDTKKEAGWCIGWYVVVATPST